MSEIAELLTHAESMTSMVKDSKQLGREIDQLESDLMESGTTETVEDVQNRLNEVDESL